MTPSAVAPGTASMADLRVDYMRGGLTELEAERDAIRQFERWFSEAVAAAVREPNAMTLSTVRADGQPSGRVVLLKGLDAGRFVFFTNYGSAKGRELAANPRAALVFFWAELERQVVVRGRVERVSREASLAYFKTRPLPSRLGAWASEQSQPISGRGELEERYAQLQRQHADGEVPLPPHWGGFALTPAEVEFWQGRASRLHDRLLYRREGAAWRITRLSP